MYLSIHHLAIIHLSSLSIMHLSIYQAITSLSVCLWQWFQTRDDFAPRGQITRDDLAPRGQIAMSGDILAVTAVGEGNSWHLASGDQGSCSAPHRAQDAPHQTVLQPQVSVLLRLRNSGRNNGLITQAEPEIFGNFPE